MNDAAAKMLGYECHELANQDTQAFYQDDTAYEAFGRDAYGNINAGHAFHSMFKFLVVGLQH